MHRLVTVELEPGHSIQCYSPPDLAIHNGDRCIIEEGRIQEYGQVTAMRELPDYSPGKSDPVVLRCATLQDQSRAKEVALQSKMAMEKCTAKLAETNPEMRLARVRFSFDSKVLMITFSAEERVDFRVMIKELAQEFHARIEMKQIGVRDEAAMVGGIGPCGRVQCCTDWLKHFESINVKMAKNQRLSLNPGAISGMCGRLKCCLRYENEQYKECARKMPRDGSTVDTPDGRGRIIDRNILLGKIVVRLDDERVMHYDKDDVKTVREFRRRPDARRSRRTTNRETSK